MAERPDFNDRLVNEAETIAVNSASAADLTVKAISTGRRWIVLNAGLQAENAAQVLTIKSGSTAISGPISFSTADELRVWSADPFLWRSSASGDDMVINLGHASQVNGWVTLVELVER